MITPPSERKGGSPSGSAANALSARRFSPCVFIELFLFSACAGLRRAQRADLFKTSTRAILIPHLIPTVSPTYIKLTPIKFGYSFLAFL